MTVGCLIRSEFTRNHISEFNLNRWHFAWLLGRVGTIGAACEFPNKRSRRSKETRIEKAETFLASFGARLSPWARAQIMHFVCQKEPVDFLQPNTFLHSMRIFYSFLLKECARSSMLLATHAFCVQQRCSMSFGEMIKASDRC